MVSRLGKFNFFVAQWSFFRLAEVVDIESGKHLRWKLLGPALPLTGWWSPYVYVGGKK